MATYAIVETGGKQYRVEEGQSLLVDRLPDDEGSKVNLRAVMFRDDSETVLEPKQLEKVKVEAKVAGHERGKKIRVFKYKPKNGYRKRHGHRSELTRLEVTGVKLLSRKPAAKKADAEDKKAEKPDAKKAETKKAETKKAEAKKGEAKKAETKKPEAKKAETKKPEAKKADPKPESAEEKATEKTEEATD